MKTRGQREMGFVPPDPWTMCVCSDLTGVPPASTLQDAPDGLFTTQRSWGLRQHRLFLPKEGDAPRLQQPVPDGPFGKVMSLL